MSFSDHRIFFSIAFDLIVIDTPLPYDLFVNSSGIAEREKFVRIFPRGEQVSVQDRKNFRHKYHQLYVLEDQRGEYLKSLAGNSAAGDVQKSEIIKDSAIHYLSNIFEPGKEFTTEVLVKTIEGCRESIESMVDVISDYKIQDLQALIGNLSFHDFYTYDHSVNVSMYVIGIYRMLKPNSSKSELVQAGLGGLLHDLGKIKIPTEIINNPGKLTDEQFAYILKHPDYGRDLLHQQCQGCQGVDLNILSRVVHEHHENFNGTGYPKKLEGVNIHVLARITAIADFFDAITTKRSYHEVLPIDDALAIMEKTAGKKIDPHIFQLFKKNVASIAHAPKLKIQLPDDFDPCQPHDALPFQDSTSAPSGNLDLLKKDQAFGKVMIEGDEDFITGKKKVKRA